MDQGKGKKVQVENFVVPAELMLQIMQVINTLPYGRVAPLAGSLGKLIQDQQKQAEAVPPEFNKENHPVN